MKRWNLSIGLLSASALIVLAACGGGGGGSDSGAAPATGTVSGANAGATSSGTVSAFGSVFVNGHEFATHSARVVDDDNPAAAGSVADLEVGMSVEVKAASTSSDRSPVADEIHLHPLVRGVVDGSDGTAGTLVVMGQKVQLTASTNFSDHRACVTAATSPCTAISGQSGLAVTAGSTAGSYVTVHGYLYTADAASGSANVVATLVSVRDLPATPGVVAYKAEGLVSAVASGSLTIGGLSVNLASAKCVVAGAVTPCASAFSAGQVVSAVGATAPALPATSFSPDFARLRSKIVVETAGAAVEMEGKVSSVTASPASFVLRGVTVDASSLTSGSLPAVGDIVKVVGTVATGGTSITATTVKLLHAARASSYAFEADLGSVAAGSAANTYVLTVLGQPVNVDATTRLADLTLRSGGAAAANPFNITTFQAYLAASTSKHLLVRSVADGTGSLQALSVLIVPASTAAAISGVVDATPAPVNATSTTPMTFSVHGLVVTADAGTLIKAASSHDEHGFGGMLPTTTGAVVAAGDLVLARGSFASGGLKVVAGTGTRAFSSTNVVIDFGAGTGRAWDHDGF